jgi:hypothetical protein
LVFGDVWQFRAFFAKVWVFGGKRLHVVQLSKIEVFGSSLNLKQPASTKNMLQPVLQED